MPQSIAFLGLGIMGLPMAGHLLQKSGGKLTVYNRTKVKAGALAKQGATVADSPAAAAKGADVIFVCVSDTPDVEAMIFGENGLASTAKPGSVVVDHSTISPMATKSFAQRLAAKSIALIDAPVSGGDTGAKNGTLSIMCGGDKSAFDRVLPLLQCYGKTITHCGDSGQGQATKLVNQVLVLGTLLSVCEAMTLVKKSGLDPQTTLAAVGAGAAASWQLQNLGPKIAAGDFAPGFRCDLAAKDLRLVLEFVDQQELALPGIALVRQLYNAVISNGGAGDGTQAMFKALAMLNGWGG